MKFLHGITENWFFTKKINEKAGNKYGASVCFEQSIFDQIG